MIILKPSKIQGIGVFTTKRIKVGEIQPLFQNKDTRFLTFPSPIEKKYCVKDKKGWWCPLDFRRMSIGWYLNHSINPNIETETWRTLKEIKKGEELTINYKFL